MHHTNIILVSKKVHIRGWAKTDGSVNRTNSKASVKGKKALARARALQQHQSEASKNSQAVNHISLKSMPSAGSEYKSEQRGEELPILRISVEAPLTTLDWPEAGYEFRGNCIRDTENSESEKIDEEIHGKLAHDKVFPRLSSDPAIQSSCSISRTENGSASMQNDVVLRGGADKGDVEAMRMDFEKGDQFDASF